MNILHNEHPIIMLPILGLGPSAALAIDFRSQNKFGYAVAFNTHTSESKGCVDPPPKMIMKSSKQLAVCNLLPPGVIDVVNPCTFQVRVLRLYILIAFYFKMSRMSFFFFKICSMMLTSDTSAGLPVVEPPKVISEFIFLI